MPSLLRHDCIGGNHAISPVHEQTVETVSHKHVSVQTHKNKSFIHKLHPSWLSSNILSAYHTYVAFAPNRKIFVLFMIARNSWLILPYFQHSVATIWTQTYIYIYNFPLSFFCCAISSSKINLETEGPEQSSAENALIFPQWSIRPSPGQYLGGPHAPARHSCAASWKKAKPNILSYFLLQKQRMLQNAGAWYLLSVAARLCHRANWAKW